jgi:predicted pyridoxine 5'-phosphate oxidase superfamily flavin-nucleotide-binding protein
MTRERLDDLARNVIDSNRYMALGTADADGHPRVSPVWFADSRLGRAELLCVKGQMFPNVPPALPRVSTLATGAR